MQPQRESAPDCRQLAIPNDSPVPQIREIRQIRGPLPPESAPFTVTRPVAHHTRLTPFPFRVLRVFRGSLSLRLPFRAFRAFRG